MGTHQGHRLEDVSPREFPPHQGHEVTGHGNDQHQFHPLRGLKVNAARQLDPAPRSQHLGADDQYGDQRQDKESVYPVNEVEQTVVVDDGEDEHRTQAAENPQNLLLVEPNELGVQGCAVDLEDADHGQQHHEPQQGPVKVAERKKTPHLLYSLPCTNTQTNTLVIPTGAKRRGGTCSLFLLW
jgi:hypothetical protein